LKYFLELTGNEKLHSKIILIFLLVIIGLLLYIVFMEKEIEVFIDPADLYDIMMQKVHCVVCHPK
jgi:hypothetical protein